MTVNTSNENGNLTVKITGRLDSTTAGDLEDVLSESITENTVSLTMDLSETDFISSKGLRILVSTYKTMKGREMYLTGANASITELLELSGLLKIFRLS